MLQMGGFCMSLLKMENVSKYYKSGGHMNKKLTRAVENVSLEIREKECIAIVGESGSGKSTLGRLIVGIEEPTKGEVFFRDKPLNVKHMDRKVRQAMQMVYQNSYEATNPRFSAKMVVDEPLRYFKLAPKDKRGEIIENLLETVGIPAVEIEKKTGEFSGGQLQRICIARALASNPEVILLDEPLSSLDVSVQAQIINLLKALKEKYGFTYILISHDLKTVYNLSDRLVIMYFGRVVEEIDDIKMFAKLCHPYTRLLLGTDTRINQEAEIGQGCPFAARCPVAEERCFMQAPELKEIEPGHRAACYLMESGKEK